MSAGKFLGRQSRGLVSVTKSRVDFNRLRKTAKIAVRKKRSMPNVSGSARLV